MKPETGCLCLPPSRVQVPLEQSIFLKYEDTISRQNLYRRNRKGMSVVCFVALGSTNIWKNNCVYYGTIFFFDVE